MRDYILIRLQLAQDERRELAAAAQTQLREDVVHVSLDGWHGNAETRSDLLVGEPLDDEFGDLAFAAGQLGEAWHSLRTRAERHGCRPVQMSKGGWTLGNSGDGRRKIVRSGIRCHGVAYAALDASRDPLAFIRHSDGDDLDVSRRGASLDSSPLGEPISRVYIKKYYIWQECGDACADAWTGRTPPNDAEILTVGEKPRKALPVKNYIGNDENPCAPVFRVLKPHPRSEHRRTCEQVSRLCELPHRSWSLHQMPLTG